MITIIRIALIGNKPGNAPGQSQTLVGLFDQDHTAVTADMSALVAK